VQAALFCLRCLSEAPSRGGLCLRCYRAALHSRSRFNGHRDAILARDGRCCRSCGARENGRRLHVHHCTPGLHDPSRLITLCAACHARVHKLASLRTWLPEALVKLWAEQHPLVPLQLQLPFESREVQ
jgi:5-methylcytosine-specific restriction endonuclease McrA